MKSFISDNQHFEAYSAPSQYSLQNSYTDCQNSYTDRHMRQPLLPMPLHLGQLRLLSGLQE